MVTEQEARDMWDAIQAFQLKDSQAQQAIEQQNRQIASDWWDTVKPAIPQTRQEALDAFHFIEGLLKTETDRYRLALLRQKLQEANEKFKERKRNG